MGIVDRPYLDRLRYGLNDALEPSSVFVGPVQFVLPLVRCGSNACCRCIGVRWDRISAAKG